LPTQTGRPHAAALGDLVRETDQVAIDANERHHAIRQRDRLNLDPT